MKKSKSTSSAPSSSSLMRKNGRWEFCFLFFG